MFRVGAGAKGAAGKAMAPRGSDRDDYDDRPRRTWKEIDQMRDGRKSGGGQFDRERERFQRTTGYSRYK